MKNNDEKLFRIIDMYNNNHHHGKAKTSANTTEMAREDLRRKTKKKNEKFNVTNGVWISCHHFHHRDDNIENVVRKKKC